MSNIYLSKDPSSTMRLVRVTFLIALVHNTDKESKVFKFHHLCDKIERTLGKMRRKSKSYEKQLKIKNFVQMRHMNSGKYKTWDERRSLLSFDTSICRDDRKLY
jgi:hypothetical protein